MKLKENVTIEGHTLEYSYSGTGSRDPWTSKFLRDHNINKFMLCTADVAYFILVDGDTVYKHRSDISKFEDVKEMSSWEEVQDWLNMHCDEPYSLKENIELYLK